MEKTVEQVFAKLKTDVSTYARWRFELLKLNTYERVAKVIAILSCGLLLLLLAFFAFLFLFLALGVYLGELLHSEALGWLLVAGMYLLLFVVMFLCRRQIQDKLLNEMIVIVKENDKKANQEKGISPGATRD